MAYTVLDKHNDFKTFHDKSEELFEKFLKAYREDDFGKSYGLSVCPGGWNGGRDLNCVDITYGSIPIGKMVENRSDSSNTLCLKTEAEQGAWMRIYHYGNGKTLISIFPSHTERFKPRENEIILGLLTSPKRLLKGRYRKKLMRILKSYMAVTSSFGKASPWDCIRVGWIRFTRIRIVDEKQKPILYLDWLKKILAFIFQIGFSGFVVVLVLEKIFNQ